MYIIVANLGLYQCCSKGSCYGAVIKFSGCLLFFSQIPHTCNTIRKSLLSFFFHFPRATVTILPLQALPSSEDTDQKRMDKMDQEKIDSPKTGKQLLKDTMDCSKRLLRNKVYVFNSLSTIFMLFGIIGFATFVPKYFEFHFRMNASSSGTSGGLSKAVATIVGILLSGIVIQK